MIHPACKACDGTIGERNKTGFCRHCYPAFQSVCKRPPVAAPRREYRESMNNRYGYQDAEKGLLKSDAKYREQMAMANRQFVARLIMAKAA